MVCLGNICRSPIAEGVLQHLAKKNGLQWEIDSAGTLPFHIGEPPHPFSCIISKKNGIDISNQTSRLFVKEDFERYDVIFSMAKDVIDDVFKISSTNFDSGKIRLLMDTIYPGEGRDIPDPYYGNEKDYEPIFKMIFNACAAFIEQQTNPANNTN